MARKPTFADTLKTMQAMHDGKSKDYGLDDDPFANIRSCEEYNIPGWVGCCLKMGDKFSRIKSFLRKGRLENESLEDSLIDLAVYATIALTLYRQGLTQDAKEPRRNV